jgi:putative SOS response-associated peptidase YedK
MCERIFQGRASAELAKALQVTADVVELAPRFNVAAGSLLTLLRASEHGRRLEARRWGLVAPFFPNPDYGAKCTDARVESVNTKAAYRAAFRKRRCIIPIDGYYTWTGGSTLAVAARDRAPLYVAGLWEDWTSPDGTRSLATCAIISVAAKGFASSISRRMPALLAPELHARWLGEERGSVNALQGLLRTANAPALEAWRVSDRVRDPQVDGADLIAPI